MPWQVDIVERHPGQFLRGAALYVDPVDAAPSVGVDQADIRQLFVYACELVGIAWRPWGRYHISVARRDAVELLDRFVGPKR